MLLSDLTGTRESVDRAGRSKGEFSPMAAPQPGIVGFLHIRERQEVEGSHLSSQGLEMKEILDT
jgi:hypothetical protein